METLEQIRDKLVRGALDKLKPRHAAIDALIVLYDRRISGDEPTGSEWAAVRGEIHSALALALALALDRDLDIDLDLALDLDLDLDLDLTELLGDRIKPMAIDSAILAALGSGKYSLDMGRWHCGTTHCRAGFATTLHPMGAELERVFGVQLAASVIYLAARRGTPLEGKVPDFFADTGKALNDIRKCAEMEEKYVAR